MRILLIALLLAGCSVAELKGGYEGELEDEKGNERILHAEHECAESGLVIGTMAYDKCLDDALEDEPKLKALLAKMKADFAKRTASGIQNDDRQCESFGYYRGTAAYNICLEYARDNKAGGVGRINGSRY